LKNDVELCIKKINFIPHREQSVVIRNTTWLLLFRKIISTNCENHTKHIQRQSVGRVQHAGFLNVTMGGTHLYHRPSKG